MPTVSRYPLPPNDEGTAKQLASGRMRPTASCRCDRGGYRVCAGPGRGGYLPWACLIKAKAAWMSWDFWV